MKSLLKKTGLLTITMLCILAAGCSLASPEAAATPMPTTDPATYVAAAVETISVQMTEQALLNPTATPEPSATPEPTATPIPPTPTVVADTPTASPTDTPQYTNAAAVQYVTTWPENKREYVPNETYSLAIGFKNTGTVTWEPGYTLKLVDFKGEITCQPEASIDRAVEPGEKAEFAFWAFGSEMLGEHTWYFQLYNSAGIPVPGGSAAYTYTSY